MANAATCHDCAYSYFDACQWLVTVGLGWPSGPVCANHPESLGRTRPTPAGGVCPNYRPRPETPEGEVKQIPLGDGFYTYVDAADFEWLNQWTWSLVGAYVGRYEKGKLILMHREIVQPPEGRIVDHKNRNKLDNTRVNLRVCTHQENAYNRGKRRGTSSRFRGVSRRKKSGKYHAQICYDGEQLFLGLFTDEIEAARAHDRKAVELFGEFARLNFPEEWPAERRAEVRAQRDAAEKTKGRRDKAKGKSKKAKGRNKTARAETRGRREQAQPAKVRRSEGEKARKPAGARVRRSEGENAAAGGEKKRREREAPPGHGSQARTTAPKGPKRKVP